VVVVGATVVVVVVVGAAVVVVVVVVVGAIAPSPNITPVRVTPPVIVIGIFHLKVLM
jgi:hypothetical protein